MMTILEFDSNFLSSCFKTDKVLIWTLCVLVLCKVGLSWFKSRKRPPGPRGLPIFGYLPFLGQKAHETIWKMKEKYGDVVGLYMGPHYTVVLNDYKIAKEVLSHPAALDRAPHVMSLVPQNGVITANGPAWVEQRRFFMSSARDLGLGKGQWESIISEEVCNFIKILQDGKGKPIDIHHSLGVSIASNVLSLLIGRTLSEDQAQKIDLALTYNEMSLQYSGISDPANLIPGLRKLLEFLKIGGYHRAASTVKEFFQFLKEEVSRHKTSPEFQNVKDFINLYLEKWKEMENSKKNTHSYSDDMLLGNLSSLFLGSADTTFNSLLWLIPVLAKHQDVQTKVHKELMDVLGMDGTVSWSEKDKIPYTFAVILEMLRYFSFVPFPGPRRAVQEIEINGYVIPKGSDILANLWGLHHDPAYWNEPHVFKPERFFVGDDKINFNPPSFAPFSLGRRDCPGRTVAEMEILLYLTEIVKHFRITPEPGKEVDFDPLPGLLLTCKPQKFCFVERKNDS